ncbi:protein yippee-like At3g08990 [Actinidia eriantha]|uniref:protein yippee-like At3g08990 n=1 Tax=Actinidia eriantha TaxID=165200 RepID=UPI00258A64CA|nr:protein yippee-like At3g08990 [Actinidia eriantha]
MPGALLIRFDQTDPDNKFYLCRSCQAHIVLSRDFRVIFSDHGLAGRVFDNVVNVHIFSPDRGWKVGDHTVTDVYCIQCCNILGVKIVRL